MSKRQPDPYDRIDPLGEDASQQRFQSVVDGIFREVAPAIADIRSALVEEGWFDRTPASITTTEQSLGWERRDQERDGDPMAARWSASDQQRQRTERDHTHDLELDH